MRNWLRRWWLDLLMGTLAIATIWLAVLPPTPTRSLVVEIIWGVFVVEYAARLIRSQRRLAFVRSNLPDLVAILPWDLLRGARLLRLLRLMRIFRGTEVLWRASATIRGILRTNELRYVLLLTTLLVTGSGIMISRVEPGITSISDGLWWSLVTTTTVGYGDIAPRTNEGRLIAAILMLAGIGTVGMVTGSIATFFLGRHGGSVNSHVRHLQHELNRWDVMTIHEKHQLLGIFEAIVKHDCDHAAVQLHQGTSGEGRLHL